MCYKSLPRDFICDKYFSDHCETLEAQALMSAWLWEAHSESMTLFISCIEK